MTLIFLGFNDSSYFKLDTLPLLLKIKIVPQQNLMKAFSKFSSKRNSS